MNANSTLEFLFLYKLILIVLALVIISFTGLWALNKLYGRQRVKTLIFAVVLIIISSVAATGVAEVVVRYIYRDITSTPDNRSYFALHWQRKHPPRLNSMGFREREISLSHTVGVYRIAVIGDSLTYGQGVIENERFTNVLEKHLNLTKWSGRYEVVNFGRPGAETADHIAILKESALRTQPDFILLQWYVNDAEGHNKDDRPWFNRLLPSDILTSYLHANSALFYLINQQWQKMQPKFGLGSGYDYTEYMIRRFKDPDSKHYQEARQAMQDFLFLCKSAGVPVGIVIFPELADDILDDYPLGFLLDRVLALCKEKNIPCLDMRPTFGAVHPSTQLWVNRFDAHPGPLANELAALDMIDIFGPIWRSTRSVNNGRVPEE